jgi:hypothetical protein
VSQFSFMLVRHALDSQALRKAPWLVDRVDRSGQLVAGAWVDWKLGSLGRPEGVFGER